MPRANYRPRFVSKELRLSAPSDPPFIMRQRDAINPAERAVTEIVGSGPFRFIASEYAPGSRIIYARNPDYVPRDEAVDRQRDGQTTLVSMRLQAVHRTGKRHVERDCLIGDDAGRAVDGGRIHPMSIEVGFRAGHENAPA